MSVTLMLAADLVHVGGGLGFFLGAAGWIGSHAAVAVKQVRIRSRRRCSRRAESYLRRCKQTLRTKPILVSWSQRRRHSLG
jgi:hypothetical protein